MRSFHGLAVAALLSIGAVGAAVPAFAQDEAPAPGTGMTLTRADYESGYFVQGQGGAWTEYQGARVMYHFREIGRTADAVTLLDASRDARVELNLATQMIRVSWSSGTPFQDLYPMTAARHRADGA